MDAAEGIGGVEAAVGADDPANSLGVLGNFGVTDNQVSDQQLFTA